jgi:hypothetical protein
MGGSAAEAAGEAEIGVVVLGAERLVRTVSSRARLLGTGRGGDLKERGGEFAGWPQRSGTARLGLKG